MDTERASPRYSDLDVWAPLDIVEAMIEGQFTAVAAVRAARFALLEAALAAAERLRNGGRLVYVGARTARRLAGPGGAGPGSALSRAARAAVTFHSRRPERLAAVGGRRRGRGRSSCSAYPTTRYRLCRRGHRSRCERYHAVHLVLPHRSKATGRFDDRSRKQPRYADP